MFVYGIYQVNCFKIMYEIRNNVTVTNHYRFVVQPTDFNYQFSTVIGGYPTALYRS